MTQAVESSAKPRSDVLDVRRTQCCIVGGGPAGMMLGYLLAHRGVAVTLLEAHKDFDREFRGDTVHPSTLEVLDSLGLADRLLRIPHAKLQKIVLRSPSSSVAIADFSGLATKFPYIAMIPQVKFLDFLADEALKLPSFQLVMGANAKALVEEGGVVRGVRYQTSQGWHEVRASLTVAADGRFSKIRSLAGLEPVKTSPPMDVLWFSFPKSPTDLTDVDATFSVLPGRMLIRLDRHDYWQLGYIILKGGYQQTKADGIESFRRSLAELAPDLRDRVETITGWTQITPLAVESSRLRQWHRPGLLLIGDAAHVMSPVGGVGINYAIQDAVVATNLLADRLRSGTLDEGDVAEVQRKRELPTRIIQGIQSLIQSRLVGRVFDVSHTFRAPWIFSFAPARRLIIRMFAFGPVHVHLEPAPAEAVGAGTV